MSSWMKLAFWFVALNALAGAGSLMFFPTQTLFFWDIKPAINAALFGALYLGGALATGWLTWRGQWESARFLVPVLVCAGALISITTLLHLDKFEPGIKLAYWLLVYIGAPLLALLFYIQHERAGADWSVTHPVKPITRAIAVAWGGVLVVLGLLILIWPSAVVANWPWPTGALMIRVFASWFMAFGVGLLWFWVEREWTRVQHRANLMIGAAVLDLLMVFLHRADIATTGLSLWVYCFHLALFGCVGLLMHGLQHDAQRAVSFSSSPQVSAR
jgi:hypothetical protein